MAREYALGTELCFYRDVQNEYTIDVDMQRLCTVRSEIENSMFRIMYKTHSMYKTLLECLGTKKTAKHAFENKELLHDDTRKLAIKAIDWLLQKCDFGTLAQYTNALKPKYHILLKALDKYKKQTKDISKSVYSEIHSLKQRYKEQVVDVLCASCYPLVIHFANRIKSAKLSKHDRISYGNIGLVKAVHRFDFTAGVKFSTYARWWICDSIYKGIYSDSCMVKLDSDTYWHYLDLMRKDKKEGVTQEAKNNIKQSFYPVHYQHTPEGQNVFEVPDKSGTVEEKLAYCDWRDNGQRLLKEILTFDEYAILVSFFGLFGNEPKSITLMTYETGKSHFILSNLRDKAVRKLKYAGIGDILDQIKY